MGTPEAPNFLNILIKIFPDSIWAPILARWENLAFAILAALFLIVLGMVASRRSKLIPGRFQCAFELIVESTQDFVCGLLGPHGRSLVPFIGTLFLYIFVMNIMGLIPFLKSPTTNLNMTAALALSVFFYVQYVSVKELGLWGYLDHLMAKPRGILAWSIIFPVFMLVLHIILEFTRPLTLALRLRSTMYGDDILIAVFAGFGFNPVTFLMLVLNYLLAFMTAVLQTMIFGILTTAYFALVLVHDD